MLTSHGVEMNFGIDRRNFVLASSAAFAANGPVRAGIIGAGGRGRFLTGKSKEIGVQMAAVCDVYEPNLKAGLAAASTGAVAYGHYRKLLEDKSIPVVIVATPDHWHTQMVIDAVHETKRIVQVGVQRRSSELLQEAHRQMKGGSGRRTVDQIVGQAAHMIGVFHWFMGSQHPSAVTTAGGRANLEGVEIPETTTICLEFPENFFPVFAVGHKAMRYAPVNDQMAQFHGSGARFDFGREGYSLYSEDPKAGELKQTVEKKLLGSFGPATRAHIRNFLDGIKTRQQPNALAEALRKGARVRFNPNTRGMEA